MPVGDETARPGPGLPETSSWSPSWPARTSDTLSRKEKPALVEPWVLPNPLLPVAIRARSKGDEDELATALQRMVAEDVTMRLERDAETHQLVLWAMGPAHVDQLIAAAASRATTCRSRSSRCGRRCARPSCAPRKVQGRLVKQSGGHGQYAVCHLEIEPLERGAGIEFVDKVVGGAVPRNYIPSVEKGARVQLEKGVLAGYPVVDVRITLVDGKAHSVDSSDMAFQTAAGHGAARGGQRLDRGAARARRRGAHRASATTRSVAVLADLRGRRGQVHGTEPAQVGGRTVIHAEVPAHELARYPVDLRSVSHGTGSFTRSFVRYDYMPPALAREVTAG